MVGKIQPCKIGIVMYNIGITTLHISEAKKRWRRAYFIIYFVHTIAKSIISKAPLVTRFPAYAVIDIIQQIVVPKVSNDQKQLINSVHNNDLEETLENDLDQGINGRDFNKMIIVFGSNTYEIPTPVGLFYFAVESFCKDVTILIPQVVVPKVGIDIKEVSLMSYSIDQTQLTDIVKNKDLKTLHRFDGVTGLAKTLDTNLQNGINGQDLYKRKSMFGCNTYTQQPPKSLFYFVAKCVGDKLLLILMGCAALSLGFGIKKDGIKYGWYEGGSILLVVFLVIVVSSISNFRHEKQFASLSIVRNNTKIGVVRDGRIQKISIFDIVVGDVVVLNVGDQVPADGLFIDGYSLVVDESTMTGESEHQQVKTMSNPFLFSGSQVADGHGRMLVLSVGMNTEWGLLMSSIADKNEETPLQSRLSKLATSVKRVSLGVAFLVLVVMLIRYFIGNTKDENGNREFNGKHTSIYEILYSVTGISMVAVTIVVMAIPEGLRLAVTLTLSHYVKRMMADQAMVMKLSACETLGSTTVICTNKTGTLTMNQMSVTKFWIGMKNIKPQSSNIIDLQVLNLLREGGGFNTAGAVFTHTAKLVPEYSVPPTEEAILSWAVEDLDIDMEKLKQSSTILHVVTFNSNKKRSGVLIRRKNDNTIHVHWKGAAEMVLAMCSKYYNSKGRKKIIDSDSRTHLKKIIEGMSASSLRCIAFAHKKVLEGTKTLTKERLTLLGIVGLKDPCRCGSKIAIEACRFAGVEVKMITGDNVFTAKAIATECGILESGQKVCEEAVVEGVEFRNFTDEERMQKVDKIRVMARSSSFDKLLMVNCLKRKGHVVAVNTNDASALREANIGLSSGTQATEVAKQSSDIVIMDDNMLSIYAVLMWGRFVYLNIEKFIQFQLTVIISALVINFISAVTSGGVPLTVVQLLWVNLIMDTLGALALATERLTKELSHRPPVGQVEPLITNIMWKNLFAQAVFQIIVLLTLHYKGKVIFNVDERVKNTIIFNTFVLCQVLNVFNLRKQEKWNVFRGIHKSRLFVGIIGIIIILQVVLVEFLNKFADTERLSGVQWGICFAIAALSWPVGCFSKLVPVPAKPFISYIITRK